MRRQTHLALGAAVALPIAVSVPPEVAAGCIWWGMVGGGLPDWFDLRSEMRRPLRLQHRGTSHSLFFLIAVTVLAWFGLELVGQAIPELSVTGNTHLAWVASFALGVTSHIVSDGCTHGGIRPFLPFSQFKMWFLPEFLRSRSDGWLDRLVWWLAIIALGFGLVIYAGVR